MAADPLIDRLRARPDTEWVPREGARPDDLVRLEHRLGGPLSAEHRALLVASDGGELYGRASALILHDVDRLVANLSDDAFTQYLPHQLVIGEDGGGHVFFVDPAAAQGAAGQPVSFVPLGALSLRSAVPVGDSLADVVDAILRGDRFTDRLR
ncbi:MAG: SMI1/KNR4 family protein [Vicinamibacterales bacterium]